MRDFVFFNRGLLLVCSHNWKPGSNTDKLVFFSQLFMLRHRPNQLCLLRYSARCAFWCNLVTKSQALKKNWRELNSVSVHCRCCCLFTCASNVCALRKLLRHSSTVMSTFASVFYTCLVLSGRGLHSRSFLTGPEQIYFAEGLNSRMKRGSGQ